VPIGILAFILIATFAPPLRHENKPKIDYAGAALIAVFLSVLILAVDNTGQIFKGLLSSTGLTLTWLRVIMYAIVAAAGVAFVVVENKVKEPILPLSFFENRNYVKLIIVAGLFGAAFMGSILYLTQFNQQVFGASPTQSGLMLIPMVGGLVLTSILSGQIISRVGRYKIFMQIGFTVATLMVLALTTLSPTSSYGQEAIIMIFIGMGMGVAMPTLNLAIQNEFNQQQLGVATASSQLFRSLGSTLGTAIFGAMLTAGILTGITNFPSLQGNNIQATPYVQAIKSSPAAAKIGDINDSNTILNLNMPNVKSQITDAANASFAKLPAAVAQPAKAQFTANQNQFSTIVVDAFSKSLGRIFTVAAVIMAVATVFVFLLKERPLRSARATETPGEM
jgi:MFS family permease